MFYIPQSPPGLDEMETPMDLGQDTGDLSADFLIWGSMESRIGAGIEGSGHLNVSVQRSPCVEA